MPILEQFLTNHILIFIHPYPPILVWLPWFLHRWSRLHRRSLHLWRFRALRSSRAGRRRCRSHQRLGRWKTGRAVISSTQTPNNAGLRGNSLQQYHTCNMGNLRTPGRCQIILYTIFLWGKPHSFSKNHSGEWKVIMSPLDFRQLFRVKRPVSPQVAVQPSWINVTCRRYPPRNENISIYTTYQENCLNHRPDLPGTVLCCPATAVAAKPMPRPLCRCEDAAGRWVGAGATGAPSGVGKLKANMLQDGIVARKSVQAWSWDDC